MTDSYIKNVINLPNCLTIIRIFMTGIFVFFLLQNEPQAQLAAALIFALAAFTDWLDGFWARRYNLISDFGKIMDPIADKFLTLGAFGAFAALEIIPAWMLFVIAVREIVLTVFRFVSIQKGEVLAAETLGKFKTVLQMGTIIFILIFIVLYSSCPASPQIWKVIISILMYLTVGITIISGINNLMNNREAYFG